MSNFSPLLMQDITQANAGATLTANSISGNSKDARMFAAFQNEPWLADKPEAARDPSTVKLCRTDRALLFQILMVENIARSKQTQLEALHAKIDPRNHRVDTLRQSKNGPRTFDMVSQVDMDDSGDSSASSSTNSAQQESKDVFKLTLQSRNGDIFFGVNTEPLGWGKCLWGAKVVLVRDTVFSRGVFVLTRSNTIMCNGSMPAWNTDHEHKMAMYLEGKLAGGEPDARSANPRKRTADQAQ